ncbi:hypothetical protein JQC72_04170 [Polycladomyces sp. WAk]|uniref:Uncharacterized protein n=1 Tax=Polycladomyces zharkentensis TaxID=2807616 RepID=A0ABS2WGT7_9BACL|nr:hypothetical protein [Polycladomyces sp. WAk]MBN2908716.1 hypothetical protein [Polycladomyces sp. WAk]
MKTTTLYERFATQLKSSPLLTDVRLRTFAGVHFLYLHPADDRHSHELDGLLEQTAYELVKGTEWSFNCQFVRSSGGTRVYRLQFRVPDVKSFCCGNQCPQCVLLRPKQ